MKMEQSRDVKLGVTVLPFVTLYPRTHPPLQRSNLFISDSTAPARTMFISLVTSAANAIDL